MGFSFTYNSPHDTVELENGEYGENGFRPMADGHRRLCKASVESERQNQPKEIINMTILRTGPNGPFLIFISWLLLATPVCSFASDTHEITLLKFRSEAETNVWRVSDFRVQATPEWIPGSGIPLSPDKAWLVAQKWCLQHGFADPDLIEMNIHPIRSFNLLGGSVKESDRRFYYDITFSSSSRSSIPVIILFDGSVVEPGK